jgi:hypothetical protein
MTATTTLAAIWIQQSQGSILGATSRRNDPPAKAISQTGQKNVSQGAKLDYPDPSITNIVPIWPSHPQT